MELYHDPDDPDQVQACHDFRRIVMTYPELTFFQPSPIKAPWHWQVRLECADGVPAVVNFWPHKGKVQPHYGGHPGVGFDKHITALNDAIEHSVATYEDRNDFALIEG
jgi:hypothetical protein